MYKEQVDREFPVSQAKHKPLEGFRKAGDKTSVGPLKMLLGDLSLRVRWPV